MALARDPDETNGARRLRLIYNPTAGGLRRPLLDRAAARFAAAGWSVERTETARAAHAEHLAAEAAGDGELDRLVIAGGDGTIHEAINGLLRVAPALPLAILPMGTANVLAHELGLHRFEDAVEAAAGDALAAIWSGTANGRHFAMMAGVGFDAHVVAHVDTRLKRRIGKSAYVWESLRQMFRFGFPRYRVTIDGETHEAASVIVAKGRHYGGPYVAAPAARLGSPSFEVCLFLRGGRLAVLRYGLALVRGRLAGRRDFMIRTGRSVTIEGPVGDPVQGDGDIIGRLPVAISIAERPVEIAVRRGDRSQVGVKVDSRSACN
ncbi:MAG: diacylglycerol kinase family protein [Dongiaceae bacterium]